VPDFADRVRWCLLGGAVGDAFRSVRVVADGGDLSTVLDAADKHSSPHIRVLLRAARDIGANGAPDPTTIERRVGDGWVGDEALAISVAWAANSADFIFRVIAASNHAGDTDSTAAICGNILGAVLVFGAIPAGCLVALDSRDIVEAAANDLIREVADPPDAWGTRYPA
jgi:ADP-ribosylglycohydrolase